MLVSPRNASTHCGRTMLDFKTNNLIRASIALIAALLGVTSRARAADVDEAPLTETRIVQEVTTALDKALAYIADKQRPDGGWDDNNAPNALAILAMMGRGHVPGRGPYREVLERGKRFILSQQQPNGIFASSRPSHGPMYEH